MKNSQKEKPFTFMLPEGKADLPAVVNVLEEIMEPIFTLRDIGISSRVMNLLKKDILPYEVDPNKTLKLNFVEYIWLCIVKDLRQMGVELSIIAEAKEVMFRDNIDIIIQSAKNHQAEVEQAWNQTGLDKEQIEQGRQAFHDNDMWNAQLKELGLISYMHINIFEAIAYKKNHGILILKTNTIAWDSAFDSIESYVTIKNQPHIFIPFLHYILDFLNTKDKENLYAPMGIISEDEMMVLRALRSKDFKEITLKFPSKSSGKGKKFEMITVKDGELTDEQQKIITDILGLRNYQSITLKKRSDAQIYFEREHRK